MILGKIQTTMTDGKYIVIKTFKNKLDKFLPLPFIFIEALVKLYIYNEHISKNTIKSKKLKAYKSNTIKCVQQEFNSNYNNGINTFKKHHFEHII